MTWRHCHPLSTAQAMFTLWSRSSLISWGEDPQQGDPVLIRRSTAKMRAGSSITGVDKGRGRKEGDRECAHALDSVHSASLTFEHEAVFRSDEASKEIGCKGRLKTLTSCATWALIIQNRLHS